MKERIDTQNNIFLGYIYDLYEIIYSIRIGTEDYITKRLKRDRFTISWNEKIIKYPRLDELLPKLKIFAERLGEEIPSFDRLWDFCEFIRIMEKIFFYRNEPDNYIYTEMKLDGSENVRKLCINNMQADYEIRLTLERVIATTNVITLEVVRDYGVKMRNKYEIIDEFLQYEDTSDCYLIDEVNFILQDAMKTTFLSMVKQLLKEGGIKDYDI